MSSSSEPSPTTTVSGVVSLGDGCICKQRMYDNYFYVCGAVAASW
jgi:hypothetical protein